MLSQEFTSEKGRCWLLKIYFVLNTCPERNGQRKMKVIFLYFIQSCLKCNQTWHKQRIRRDTIQNNDKNVDKSHIVLHKT